MEKKYQWSKFLGENREEQVVIRADDWKEFLEAKRNIDTIINKREQPKTEQKAIPVEEFQKTCYKCGAPMITSKAGKLYCKDRCWLKGGE